MSTAARDKDAGALRFPPGIPFIVGNEAAERFSYYGMKAVLYLYVVALSLRFVPEDLLPAATVAGARADATQVTHLFFAGVYAFPLLGAAFADRLLGKYRVIFWVSLLYCAGHAALAIAGRQGRTGELTAAATSLYVGLGLISLGAGGIKPCVSANVGDQIRAGDEGLITRVFQIFYFSVNFGSLFSELAIPICYARFGPEVAFGIPGILMGIATLVFWLGRKRFIHVPPSPGGRLGLLDAVGTSLLYAPFFGVILGYFVLWRHFKPPAGAVGFAAAWAFLGHYFWLPLATVGAFVAGAVMFTVRQRLQRDEKSFLPVLLWSITNQRLRRPGQSFFDPARERFGDEAGSGPPAVLRIMLVFSTVSVFWALYDQHASTWVEQAKHMNLELRVPLWLGRFAFAGTVALSAFAGIWLFSWVGNRKIPRRVTVTVLAAVGALAVAAAVADLVSRQMTSVTMLPAQMQSLNPIMVMLIIPGLDRLVFARLARRGIEVKPLTKMTVGMFLASLAFVIAALLQAAIEHAGAGRIHAAWQAGQYFVMTTAEVLVSITGLEFAYTQAPRAMKSTIMSFWLLCITFGDLLVAFVAPLQERLPLSRFFWLFAGIMLMAALLFSVLARFYRGKTYLQTA